MKEEKEEGRWVLWKICFLPSFKGNTSSTFTAEKLCKEKVREKASLKPLLPGHYSRTADSTTLFSNVQSIYPKGNLLSLLIFEHIT